MRPRYKKRSVITGYTYPLVTRAVKYSFKHIIRVGNDWSLAEVCQLFPL